MISGYNWVSGIPPNGLKHILPRELPDLPDHYPISQTITPSFLNAPLPLSGAALLTTAATPVTTSVTTWAETTTPKVTTSSTGDDHGEVMADGEAEPLTYVPETVLKKRKDTEHVAIRRREQNEARKARTKENKKLQFKRAEQFIKEYRLQELDRFRLKRNKKLRKSSFSKSESRLLFVIRIGGTNDMHPKTKKILRLLRLRQICTGVFVILNEQTAKMLNLVEPYVTYGYPNLKSVTELIFKKGVGLVDNERIPLTDNSVIEQALGKHGIICAEDIIHEISSVGSNFKVVSNFLQPFKLTMPYGRFQNIRKRFKEGGDAGNREDQINDLISRMN